MYEHLRYEDRPITRKEKEILHLLAMGYMNGDMAAQLYVTKRTVESHMRNLFKKGRVNNRTMLLLWAAKMGHVTLADDMANLVYFPLRREKAA